MVITIFIIIGNLKIYSLIFVRKMEPSTGSGIITTSSDKLGLVFRTKNELYYFLSTSGILEIKLNLRNFF